ncbi:MAG: peptide chain release factor N(5)-glutamine methyltransferase [Chloroflexota bacterium]|nr:peptide chain release factor N(5)-glutamine methyltransferase [Chloroflexota bacterium]
MYASKSTTSSTILAALRAAYRQLAGCESAQLDAQVLLAHALGAERVYLLANGDIELSGEQQRCFTELINRRAAGEPVAYIIGSKSFYDLELTVTPDVLIPRPETELLLEEALRLARLMPACHAADIGTGSGALALAFAKHMPGSRVYATDISHKALNIARENARRYGLCIEFLLGDLAQPLVERGLCVDLLMANLPYIATEELDSLAVSKYEPALALDGGGDGLACIRRVLGQLPQLCREGAWVLLEIGADQADKADRLVRETLNAPCDVLQDYAGLDRIVRFQIGAGF